MDRPVSNPPDAQTTDRDSGAASFAAEKTSPAQEAVALQGPVLVAVDLSEDSRAAVLWASDYAQRAAAPLHILHCLYDPAESPGKYSFAKADPLEPMSDVAHRLLAAFTAELRAAHPELESLAAASTRLVAGLPAQKILDAAEALGAASIVLGSRGRNGLKRVVFGSVAHRVAQLSTIPVTVVKAPR